jgi:thiamine-monophosphate kinase
MSAERRAVSDVGEFEWIEKALRPLTEGAPEAFGLADDAAAIPARPGFDLIVSNDAIVEGVHFLRGDPPELVARKLLRVNLSDLAAKAAEPYGYFLAVSWPAEFGWVERGGFVDGLREDQRRFGLKLLGGDTTATPGPLTASVTILGWAPAGGMVRRAGAKEGDAIFVSGTVGDAFLGLKAARHELGGLAVADSAWLLDRYRLPQPRLELRDILRAHASAAVDVSDGLIADVGHVAAASGVCMEVDLDRLPLSKAASAWLETQADQTTARVALATGGDDYEVVCTAAGSDVGAGLTPIGRVVDGAGVRTIAEGRALDVRRAGYVHR